MTVVFNSAGLLFAMREAPVAKVIEVFVDRAKGNVPPLPDTVIYPAEYIGCAAAAVASTEARGGVA